MICGASEDNALSTSAFSSLSVLRTPIEMSKVIGRRASTLPVDRRDDQRRLFLRGEVTGDRAPYGGDVDLSRGDRMNNFRQRMVVAVVAVDHESAHVSDDPSLGERMRGRRVHAVVADELDADLARPEAWIVERGDRRFAGLGHEHVCRSIVGTGRERHRRARRNSGHKIAFAGVQSLAHESAPLRAPHELQGPLEIVGDQLDDLVLEPFPGGIGIGEIVRIGADP